MLLKLFLLLIMLILLLFETEGRRRKSKNKRMGKKMMLLSNLQSPYLDAKSLLVVINYCEAKHSSPRSKHTSSRTKRCINHSLDDLLAHCSDVRDKQSKEDCKLYVRKVVKKTKNLAKNERSRRPKLRSGQSEAACMLEKTRELILYDPRTHFCCDGHVIPHPRSTDNCCHSDSLGACCIGCCGGAIYNKSKQFCLNKQILNGTLTTSNAKTTTTKSNIKVPYFVNFDPNEQDDLNREVKEGNGETDTSDETHIGVPYYIAGSILLSFLAGVVLCVTTQKYRTKMCLRKFSKATFHDINTIPIQDTQDESPSTTISISILPQEMQETSTTVSDRIKQTPTELDKEAPLNREINQTNAASTVVFSTVADTHENQASGTASLSAVRNTSENLASDIDSVCSELQVKLEDLPVTIVPSFYEGILTIEGLKATLHKDSKVLSMNESSNQYSSVQTQTFPIKQSNMRDSLGKPFQGDILATITNRVIQLPHSDVVMTLPGSDLQDAPIQCYASSITDLSAMRRKLRLADDEYFASPIAEYVLPGVKKLRDHAVIKLPISQHSNNFRVIRAVSDQGEDEEFKELYDVPMVGSKSEGIHMDTFCVLSESKQLMFIYTVVFSVYLFVESGEKIHFDSNACTFVGLKRIKNKTCAMVTVNTYIFGHLSVFRDFRKDIEEDEKRFGRKMSDIIKKLNFREEVKSTDKLEVYMNIADKANWDFARDPERPNLEKQKQRVNMNEIILPRNDFSHSMVSWSIENMTCNIPSDFKCFIYIDHLNDNVDRSEQEKNVFSQDLNKSTKLRQSRHGHSVGSSLHSMESVESYLSEMEPPNRVSYDNDSRAPDKAPDQVRKEIDTSMPSSYYDSEGNWVGQQHVQDQVRKEIVTSMPSSHYDNKGNRIRPPHLANPAPELN